MPDESEPTGYAFGDPGDYVDVSLAGVTSGIAGLWWHKLANLNEDLICTDIDHEFNAGDWNPGPAGDFDWSAATLRVSSIEYPNESDPIGGRDIASYINDKIGRECLNCRENCGNVSEELDAEITGGDAAFIPFRGPMTLKAAAIFCDTYKGCWWHCLFNPPIPWHDPNDVGNPKSLVYFTEFAARLGDGRGWAAFMGEDSYGTPPSTRRYWSAGATWVIDSETGCWQNLIQPAKCLGQWQEIGRHRMYTGEGIANIHHSVLTLSPAD